MPAGKYSSDDDCEWFEGGFAVVCESAGKSPAGTPTKGVGIIGYSTEEKAYTYYGIDNTGMVPTTVAKGTMQGDVLTFTDESKFGGQLVKSRYTLTITGPKSYNFKWEMQGPDGNWMALMQGHLQEVICAHRLYSQQSAGCQSRRFVRAHTDCVGHLTPSRKQARVHTGSTLHKNRHRFLVTGLIMGAYLMVRRELYSKPASQLRARPRRRDWLRNVSDPRCCALAVSARAEGRPPLLARAHCTGLLDSHSFDRRSLPYGECARVEFLAVAGVGGGGERVRPTCWFAAVLLDHVDAHSAGRESPARGGRARSSSRPCTPPSQKETAQRSMVAHGMFVYHARSYSMICQVWHTSGTPISCLFMTS